MDNISDIDLSWVAGFLEGEGCFSRNKITENTGCVHVSANQVQFEPIEKLSRLCGGSIYKVARDKKKHPTWNDIFAWKVSGTTAIELMKKLVPLMSPKRQARIIELLAWAEKRPGKRSFSTHCWKGHLLNEENTYVYPDGKRRCKTCQSLGNKMRREERNKRPFVEELLQQN